MKLDGFDRHVWQVFGAAIGIVVTATVGWQAALGWLLVWGLGAGILFGLETGRIVLHRKRKQERNA